jgi:hypothetical protein
VLICTGEEQNGIGNEHKDCRARGDERNHAALATLIEITYS